jgi:uncharacterized protein (DUF362 family)
MTGNRCDKMPEREDQTIDLRSELRRTLNMKHIMNRRHFLKTSALAGGAALALHRLPFVGRALATGASPCPHRSQVALTGGSDQVDNIFQSLQMLKTKIAAAIGNRPVLIKVNNVSGGTVALADTPVQSLEGILEFLKSIGKTDVTIAECALLNTTQVSFSNNNYYSLVKKYPVRLKDLSEEGYQTQYVWNNDLGSGNPLQAVRMSKLLLRPGPGLPRKYFVISNCRPKTHDRVVATCSLKNVVMGSVQIDPNFYGGGGNSQNDKGHMHSASGSNSAGGSLSDQDLNDTLYRMARWQAPDLSVVDGYQGMQGAGPLSGTAVNLGCAVTSLDWLSADRVAIELMNINAGIIATAAPSGGGYLSNSTSFGSETNGWPMFPLYLNYCGQDGAWQYDLNMIDILGGKITDYRQTFALHSGVTAQLYGMNASPRSQDTDAPSLPS